jgi:non-specific serine/threonine protein kinase
MKRRGIVLAYLMKFKQICNHPDHYAGSGSWLEKESGKFCRLRELCETISEKRERVLVFTQFREIIPALDQFLCSVFGSPGLHLHGGTPVAKRRDIVAKFQGDGYVPYFILSVKAGGTGLNLTAAQHVIHFDRWWNPAVERQAEDRAYRIGQRNRVMVHKFICRGTVEEKIDEMIEKKKDLAARVLDASGGEGWITELSNKELREIFTLNLTEQEE